MSKPTEFPFSVLQRPEAADLTGREKLTLVYLAWRQGSNCLAWPSLRRIERDLRMDRRSCLRVIARLCECGCINKAPGGGRGRSNHYAVLAAEREAGCPPLPGHKGRQNGPGKGGKTVAKGRQGAPQTKENTSKTPLFARAREDFDRIWAMYPKRVGKAEAWATWEELSPGPALVAEILESISRHMDSEQWTRSLAEDHGRYIPKLATFLRRRQWEDSPAAKPDPQRGDKGWLPSDEELDAIFANIASRKEAE